MTYLESLGRQIYAAAHRGRDLPDSERGLYIQYAVLALTVGEAVTAAHVHHAWSAWTIAHHPGHPSIRPFEELSLDVQQKDERYVTAIRHVVSRSTNEAGSLQETSRNLLSPGEG